MTLKNKPVRVKKIEKVPYSGKIYDVDVENDIILVRRFNSTPVWSGNSDGRHGRGIQFDGVDDYVNTTYNGNFGTGEFTVSFWVKLNTLAPSHQNIIGNRPPQIGNTWWAGILSDGSINFDSSGYQIVSNAGEITTNVWYNIVFTRNGTTLTQYKNGISVKTGTQANNLNGGTTLAIGAENNAAEPTNGTIDEVAIYSRALSAEEIQYRYQLTSAGRTGVIPAERSAGKFSTTGIYFSGKDVVRVEW